MDNIETMADKQTTTLLYRVAVWVILAICLGLAVRYVWVAWERHVSAAADTVTTAGAMS